MLLLCSMRRFKATDPRDKVFSLLGIAKARDGVDVPFILRQSGSGEHRLIGEAFVHGIMKGEVLEDTNLEFSKDSIRSKSVSSSLDGHRSCLLIHEPPSARC